MVIELLTSLSMLTINFGERNNMQQCCSVDLQQDLKSLCLECPIWTMFFSSSLIVSVIDFFLSNILSWMLIGVLRCVAVEYGNQLYSVNKQLFEEFLIICPLFSIMIIGNQMEKQVSQMCVYILLIIMFQTSVI